MATVLSLAGARARRSFEDNAVNEEERAWDRAERLLGVLTSGGITSVEKRKKVFDDAAAALLQYLDNEWPVEKDNKCRADDVAEKAATLFYIGSAGINPSKAIAVQDKVQECLAEKFPHSEELYYKTIRKFMGVPEPVRAVTSDHDDLHM